jgi:predicted phosphodiesterase
MTKKRSVLFLLLLLPLFIVTCQKNSNGIVFSAIGDVPYSEKEEKELKSNLKKHNENSNASFLIHLGDIKPGSKPCKKEVYEDLAEILKKSKKPVYITPGDNEYNDCDHPKKALEHWKKNFLKFNEHWETDWETSYQKGQKENFSWRQEDVLFIGLHLVGGKLHSKKEWKERLDANADWLEQLMDPDKTKGMNALVIFGHANLQSHADKVKDFTKRFRTLAAQFDKPILYLHGDGHVWLKDRPWKEKNILRVQVDSGAKILKVSVDTNSKKVFYFSYK